MNCYIVGISSNMDDITIRVFEEAGYAKAKRLARQLAKKLSRWEGDTVSAHVVPEWEEACNIRGLDVSSYCCTYLHTIRDGVLVDSVTFNFEDRT